MDKRQVIRNILNSDENRLAMRRNSHSAFLFAVLVGFAIVVFVVMPVRNAEPESNLEMSEIVAIADTANGTDTNDTADDTDTNDTADGTDTNDTADDTDTNDTADDTDTNDTADDTDTNDTAESPDSNNASTLVSHPEMVTDTNGTGVAYDYSDAYFRDGVLLNQAKDYIEGTNGKTREYKKAVPILKDLVSRGSSSAEFELAKLYRFGNGVPLNMTMAIDLYKNAADKGNGDAQCSLGALYYKGSGVQKNLEKAVSYFQKAASQGDRTAQFNLGCSYLDGTGVARDKVAALEWLRKSAKQDYAPARKVLATLRK